VNGRPQGKHKRNDLVQWWDMNGNLPSRRHLSVSHGFAVQFLGLLVGLHGVYILAISLLDQIAAHRGSRLTDLTVDLPLLLGLSLIYLGGLLRRRKRTAWVVTILAYMFYLGASVSHLLERNEFHSASFQDIVRAIVLPVVILALLLLYQKNYVVRSDTQGFRFAARFSGIMIAVALIYGVAGFSLLDKSDFHREIGLPTAIHYTVDQFGITTREQLHPHTRRAQLFNDSLSFVSLGAIIYVGIALFQPLRIRLHDQQRERERLTALMERYGAQSEEFFKLWPQDKQYLFDETGQAAIAFHVSRGVALCLSDPVGDKARFKALLEQFSELCFSNDWLPAMVHVSEDYKAQYEQLGFGLQKLGEEAILDLAHFKEKVAGEKYFRQIRNRFAKHDFSCELLEPPHHQAVIDRLRIISDEWLSQGGRAERGFAMGYFSPEYMQRCQLLVARDAAGTIQAFINLVPADFDKQEATYDLLRHANGSLGNINDYLLINLIDQLHEQGYRRLNLGLCALAGLDDTEENRLVDRVFRFAYANGDRFYSFSGLHRFKAKYEPEWHDRYITYQGGLRGFSKTMTALMRAMRVR
jgi:phosphatidylglycerol lysyltransferase